MSYYPILRAPYCTGKTTLYNFPPNNWESFSKIDRYISLTYLYDEIWHSKTLCTLKNQTYKTVHYSDISSLVPSQSLPLLSLSSQPLEEESSTLPLPIIQKTITPNNRASLELYSKYTNTSYQGEIDPFPPKASLLTMSPFLQFGADIENYLILLNIEKQSNTRKSTLEIYDAKSKNLIATNIVTNNNISIISLDKLGLDIHNLPIVICRNMAAIPLYFSCTKEGRHLSLEHSHPPSSLAIHGNRFGVQKDLKTYWFTKLEKNASII
jgi:hypothetical protein